MQQLQMPTDFLERQLGDVATRNQVAAEIRSALAAQGQPTACIAFVMGRYAQVQDQVVPISMDVIASIRNLAALRAVERHFQRHVRAWIREAVSAWTALWHAEKDRERS